MKYSYAILGDVTCDLNDELRERFEIDGYTKGHIFSADGEEMESVIGWTFTTAQEFYSAMKSKKARYTTSPSSAEEIADYWESFLKLGLDILAISISGALSVTFNLMVNAQKKMLEQYPERKIRVVDSRKYSVAYGLLVIRASELRKQGLSLEENAAVLDQEKSGIHQMGSMDDLFFVASKGRMSHSKAFMGTLIGIKPLGDFDENGLVTVLTKTKGFENAYHIIIEYMKKTIINPQEQLIILAQTQREKQSLELAELIRKHIGPKELVISDIYPANGVNIGPGLLAAYYWGSPITDLENEKEIMKNVMENMQK